jgi:hypothetical protein
MPGKVRDPPSLEQVSQPILRGITPPPVREYDLLALARDGIHPFVAPGAHRLLRSVRTPIVTSTDSFEATITAARTGELPAPKTIRTEEFIAAVAAASGVADADALGLAIDGGPSPWTDARRYLLHVTIWSGDGDNARTSLAAEDVRLVVNFNPEIVRQYRLLGHEADIGGGLLSGPRANELRIGDAASVVFEIELQKAPAGDLAEVAVTWRLPNTGTVREITRPVRRGQLSATFVEAAPPVQLATIAAATAELLRGSPYTRNRFTAQDVVTLADEVHPTLYSNPRLADLLDILEAMGQ